MKVYIGWSVGWLVDITISKLYRGKHLKHGNGCRQT